MTTITQERPLRFACDGINDRQAQIVARVGDFVILEGMAMDSGSWFTMGPGTVPGRYNSKQEALDYIKYAMDETLSEEMVRRKKELKAAEASGNRDKVEAARLEIRKLQGEIDLRRGKDAEFFPGSSKASKEGQELYHKMSAQAQKQDKKDPQGRNKSGFSQSDLEGYDKR